MFGDSWLRLPWRCVILIMLLCVCVCVCLNMTWRQCIILDKRNDRRQCIRIMQRLFVLFFQ